MSRQFGTVTNMFSNSAYEKASAGASPVGFAGAGGITRYLVLEYCTLPREENSACRHE